MIFESIAIIMTVLVSVSLAVPYLLFFSVFLGSLLAGVPAIFACTKSHRPSSSLPVALPETKKMKRKVIPITEGRQASQRKNRRKKKRTTPPIIEQQSVL